LRDAARGSTDEALTAGLAEFYRAQVRSSPFESSDQQIELPVEALAQLERSALAATPDAFERNLWDEIGRLLVAKRWIPEIYEYVEPVAKRHSPWPMLEHVLARADIESLDPEAAIARLSKLTELEPDHVEHWYYLGEAQEQAKRDRDAVSSWKRSLELQPANSNTKRKIAIALFRLEDPEARRVAEELLLENPEDTEIQSLLGIETPDGTSANGDPHQH
jgi:predicted Zn-dependent protease